MSRKNLKILIVSVLSLLTITYFSTNSLMLPSGQPLYKFQKYVPGSYAAKLFDIQDFKTKRTALFESANSIDNKFNAMHISGEQIVELIEKEVFPHWYDTKYDFNGTTETPGKGKIACGYFVTTVLRDVGVPIQRVKMAQATSERMIKSMTDEENIRRFRKTPIKKFVRAIEDMGEGLYVVGLDTHAGFAFFDGIEVRFIHSTARKGISKVINEKALTSASLIRSKYRVIGKISTDEDFVRRWLN